MVTDTYVLASTAVAGLFCSYPKSDSNVQTSVMGQISVVSSALLESMSKREQKNEAPSICMLSRIWLKVKAMVVFPVPATPLSQYILLSQASVAQATRLAKTLSLVSAVQERRPDLK